ncbi:MAG TPA: hemerythrin domain-containing protein [Terracidiphilus sp.]|nr:hemerythrin domain-containing protein [Terracidiphilus sp.]
MTVQIGAKPDAGFDDPIGMLHDCHRRIERFLSVLQQVAARAAGRTLTPEERSSVEAALHYFRTGGLRHTADEEESLFPRLHNTGAALALAELDRLEHDHSRAQELHDVADALFTRWLTQGQLPAEDAERLTLANRELAALYAAHIAVEETTIFPQAAVALDKPAIAAIGEEFRRRRA